MRVSTWAFRASIRVLASIALAVTAASLVDASSGDLFEDDDQQHGRRRVTGARSAFAQSGGLVFTVNTTVDGDDFNIGDGICDSNASLLGEQCSFRAAIREVNAATVAGPHTIRFSIGTGPQTITPIFPLGGILNQVIIDATTQPGFAGVPLIEINGSTSALNVPGGDGVRLLAGNSTVRGLVINRFGNNGISLVGPAGGNVVAGNYIGTDAAGANARGNGGNGIYIDGSENRVGGTVPADRNVISGNRLPGVGITGVSGHGNFNTVQGNYIGTNAAGTAAIGSVSGSGNPSNGIVITERALGNLIGGPLGSIGPCELRCNLISGSSDFSGITIADGATSNNVEGNYIGTDVSGTVSIPNRGAIQIVDAGSNRIGGDLESRRNVISGNIEHGVLVVGINATDNHVQRNYIGTSLTGNARLPNGGDGVRIRDSDRTDVVGNVISGNGENGVFLHGADETTVDGNFIGTNAGGLITDPNGIPGDGDELGNIGTGVFIWSGDTSFIRNNVISGNGSAGVEIDDVPEFGDGRSVGNFITGNFIGTDRFGAAARPNGGSGILLAASGNVVGGGVAAGRNIISGNGAAGVLVVGSTNRIQGNFIGTNAAGDAPIPNETGVELRLRSAGNTVGGGSISERNIIAGNRTAGVWIDASLDNEIFGNFIGLGLSGSARLPNGDGVLLTNGASGNFIGQTTENRRNIISGNSQNGVFIRGANSNSVLGNYIGTDVSGQNNDPNGLPGDNDDFGNVGAGVFIWSGDNNLIGGNVISGNAFHGVEIDDISGEGDGQSVGNRVEGNLIGTNRTGLFALPNNGSGVVLSASNNVVGGTATAVRNVISGNAQHGVLIQGPVRENRIEGNYIGTAVTGGGALGNGVRRGGDGVHLSNGARGNVVGGTAAGAGNVVSSNAFSGVAIDGANDNFVLGNFVGADASGPFEPEPGLGNGTAGMFILSASGNAMRGNAITSTRGGPGVRIQNATSNTVGGTSSADRNIITGNNGFGIQVEGATASGNQVTGNRIGLNSDQAGGVRITGGAQNNAIGGGALGTGNMISGNSRAGAPGVEISGVGTDGNQVLGNLIGLEPDGTTAMPNAADGLVIGEGASRNVVGGTTSAARNVISGHQADNAVGVRIRVGSNSNDIVGNYVGTDSSGATARPNRDGISIESSNTNTLRGNLVSGNDFRGITISGTAAGRASGNRVEGSMIGTNPAGSLPIPNGSDGVSVDDAAATSSGDPAPVPGT